MAYRVHTQAFTGPFDLLLALVSRQKVAIGSISITEVADQYLAEVQRMGQLDLDVASDFLLVASTLLDMKAASLVPADVRPPVDEDMDEDAEDEFANLSPDQAREVLVQRLIAYKQFRNAGAALGNRMEAEGLVLPRTAGPDPDFQNLMPDYLEGISLRSLAVICADLDSRREHSLLENDHVPPRRLPVALTVAAMDRVVRNRGVVAFSELLGGDARPENVVANFLAMLELFKRGAIRVSQVEPFGDISIAHIEGAPAFELDESALTSIGEEGY